jgi:chemotaxis response regulator CheB
VLPWRRDPHQFSSSPCTSWARIARLLDEHEDVDLVAVQCAEYRSLQACAGDAHPDVILIAGEREDDAATHLISDVLNCWTDTPVVWIELETNVIRKYTSHNLPANSKQLIETIRQAGAGSPGAPSQHPNSIRR